MKSNKSCTKSWTEGGALDQGSSSRMIPAAYSCSSSELFIRVGVDDGVVHKHAISRGEKLKARRLGQVADRRYHTRHARQPRLPFEVGEGDSVFGSRDDRPRRFPTSKHLDPPSPA